MEKNTYGRKRGESFKERIIDIKNFTNLIDELKNTL